ncbi:hypothetical protein BJX61DRAFT_111606 [Aspergillus egyptiacus]|nr:hypothetical protein BJX61DRAFT_111606 [Aspergillus egyptiacus]
MGKERLQAIVAVLLLFMERLSLSFLVPSSLVSSTSFLLRWLFVQACSIVPLLLPFCSYCDCQQLPVWLLRFTISCQLSPCLVIIALLFLFVHVIAGHS